MSGHPGRIGFNDQEESPLVAPYGVCGPASTQYPPQQYPQQVIVPQQVYMVHVCTGPYYNLTLIIIIYAPCHAQLVI
jgi:hypothetical protein